MDDDRLLERTRCLLTDYLMFCRREPGDPEPPPTSVEAALLRSVAEQVQQRYHFFFSSFLGYQGNRVELMTQMADTILSDGQSFSWGRLVLLLAFAGTILSQRQRNSEKDKIQVDRDCQLIVGLLCNRLLGQHGSWLKAHDGWDGFCSFFVSPLPLNFWRRLLIKTFLSCFIAMAVLMIWKRF
ncbi:bcl-2-like protein 10 [Phodopus roborovskii]|uniref:Bcl-2-like protein 10 n=1 Tax=Phodopus roborovskii TaxID=109678 RepID=A0AAU9ZXF3_PHORO|nr:bcl-2-like protein 10 [Phodopus roborovskii]CAH6875820.1 Bcl2l10 [Phodopus roborovskii]